jgi:hypothetical protein
LEDAEQKILLVICSAHFSWLKVFTWLASANYNGDGKDDLVVRDNLNGVVSIFLCSFLTHLLSWCKNDGIKNK